MSAIQSFKFNRATIHVDEGSASPDMSIEIDLGSDKSFWQRFKIACQLMTRGFYVSSNFNFIDKDFNKFTNIIKNKKYHQSAKIFNVEKVFDDAFIPIRSHKSDAGWDLRSPFDITIQPKSMSLIDFGIRIEIADGYEIQARSRSGIATKFHTMLALGVGTIDCFSEDMLIKTTSDDKKINDIKINEQCVSVNENNMSVERDEISAIIDKGYGEVIVFETDEGVLEITPNTFVYTNNGMKRAKDINEDDELFFQE